MGLGFALALFLMGTIANSRLRTFGAQMPWIREGGYSL